MWAPLSDPSHAKQFEMDGPEFGPMAALLVELSKRPYADMLFGSRSMMSFGISTAIAWNEVGGCDDVRLTFDPDTQLFQIVYDEWVSATRNPQRRTASERKCESEEVASVIDIYVLRLMLSANRAGTYEKQNRLT